MAAESRVDAKERQALVIAAESVRGQVPLDQVMSRLPSMRYTKGLVMALGWAAEALGSQGVWREEALAEYRRMREWYVGIVPTKEEA